MSDKILKYKLHTNLQCAHCAGVIEEKINELPEIEVFSISILTNQVMAQIKPSASWSKVLAKIQAIAEEIEPGTIMEENSPKGATMKYKLATNLECAHCAGVIEEKVNKLPGIKNFAVALLTKQVLVELEPGVNFQDVLKEIQDIAESVEPGTVMEEIKPVISAKHKLSTNLECAHCAGVIEEKVNKLPEIKSFAISLLTKQVMVELNPEADWQEVLQKIKFIAETVEPGTTMLEAEGSNKEYIYYTNIECAHCAGLIEEAINKLPGVEKASLVVVTKQLRFTLAAGAELGKVMEEIAAIAEKIEPGTVFTRTKMAKEVKKESWLRRFHTRFHSYELVVGAILFILLSFTKVIPEQWENATYIFTYVILGIHVFKKAFGNIMKMRISDESLLMTIATGGAFIIGEHPEAIGVMLFYRIGEAFEVFATNRSRKQIISTVDMRPETISLLKENGEIEVIPAEAVNIGDLILVKPGERIPVDGIVKNGESRLDTSPITGESVPVKTTLGKEVLSGCINLVSPLTLEVTHDLSNSMVSRILDSVENAAANKPKIQRLISRFAQVYTPFVVGIAVLTAVIPSLFTGNWEYWIYAALTFLVISCPCALVLSVPLAFFSGIGMASKYGILFKGGISIEGLQKVKAVAFDKTGTLTKGVFTINEIRNAGVMEEQALVGICASSEASSTHPIAQSILNYAEEQSIALTKAENVKEISGEGVVTTLDGAEVLCGNLRLMDRYNIQVAAEDREITDTVVYVAKDKVYAGAIIIGDEIKEDAKATISKLQKFGLVTAIFTGDNLETAKKVGNALGINKVFAKLLPQDKLSKLQELRSSSGGVLFVGDGINDAPILAGADVSAAMGSGADAAIEAADIVFMNTRLQSITNAFAIAKDTTKLAWQNIVFALGIKALIMLIGLLGYASMWAAVFADSGVTLICVLNALRLFGKKYAK